MEPIERRTAAGLSVVGLLVLALAELDGVIAAAAGITGAGAGS